MLPCHSIEVPSSMDIALAYLDFHTEKGTNNNFLHDENVVCIHPG